MILKYPYIDQFIIKSKCKCKELLHVYKKSIISFFLSVFSADVHDFDFVERNAIVIHMCAEETLQSLL